MKIKLTEVTSFQGPIAKKYIITEDKVEVIANPTLHNAEGLQLEVEESQVNKYLDGLAEDSDKCLILGIHGELGGKYHITTREDLEKNPGDRRIARTLEFFDWANSGSVSLALLDFDSSASPELREAFLNLLDQTLAPALIGETGKERSHICKWKRPSTSASVSIDGKSGQGLHVFIPVKSCNSNLIKLIHQFCWLQFQASIKGFKVSKRGVVLEQSMIDHMVGSPERIVYTSDAEVQGNEERWQKIERTCSYHPGGVLDAEVACGILEPLVLEFDKKWALFKESKSHLPEVIKQQQEWKKEEIAKNIAKGMSPELARKTAECGIRGILLSSVTLLKTNGDEVHVSKILANPSDYIGEKHFNDPHSDKKNRNVAMIIGPEQRPKLKSFAHGGVIYELKWTYQDLDEWITTATNEEVEEWYKYFQVNSEMSELQKDNLQKKVSKKLGANIPAIRKDIANVVKEEKLKTMLDSFSDDPDRPTFGMQLSVSSSHGDIMEDYVANCGDCISYGESLWIWDGGSIWKEHDRRTIKKNLRRYYNHVEKCQRSGDYKALAEMVISDNDKRQTEWKEAHGFPCSDGFYKVDPTDKANDGVVLVPYSKELGCYFKIGFKPDPKIPFPGFQRIIDNVENKILFQQLFGLALCGHLNHLQRVFVMIGRGGEGKGTTARILTAMLPPNRVTACNIKDMNQEYYKAYLANSRINIISETQRSRIDMTGIKQLTGGDLISARQPAGTVFQFYARCSFILSVNDIFSPEFMGDDIKRRFGHSMVKFRNLSSEDKLSPAEQDRFEENIIQHELPGILAWAVEGVRMYFRDGKLDDEYSLGMFQKWVTDVDPVAHFVDEFVKVTGDHDEVIERSELWERYKEWAEVSLIKGVNKGDFFHQFAKHPVIGEPQKLRGVYYFRGCHWDPESCPWVSGHQKAIKVRKSNYAKK